MPSVTSQQQLDMFLIACPTPAFRKRLKKPYKACADEYVTPIAAFNSKNRVLSDMDPRAPQ